MAGHSSAWHSAKVQNLKLSFYQIISLRLCNEREIVFCQFTQDSVKENKKVVSY